MGYGVKTRERGSVPWNAQGQASDISGMAKEMWRPPLSQIRVVITMASQTQFEDCVGQMQSAVDPASISSEESLLLYGLHKQAVYGDAEAKQPCVGCAALPLLRCDAAVLDRMRRPFYDVLAMDKWKAWQSRKGMSAEAARAEFIAIASGILAKRGVASSPSTPTPTPVPLKRAASTPDASSGQSSPVPRAAARFEVRDGSVTCVGLSLVPWSTTAVPVPCMTHLYSQQSNSSSKLRISNDKASAVAGPVKKTGTLLKQRDFLKGWRARYFILENKTLYYYKQQRDALPRGAVVLESVRVRWGYSLLASV